VRVLYRIDAAPDAPAEARRIVQNECGGRVGRGTLEKLQLLVSELVTNGVVHGRTARDRSIMLELLINSSLRCSVVDFGPGFARRAARNADGGWGLRLVERLADRWGVNRSGQGTRVWFETAAE
jgi:anti-sigma regulatory factor (Ser/Thr protein kinase)